MSDKRKRILVIDDEFFLLKSITRILEDAYDVTSVLHARLALDLLNKHEKYDIIISDLSMPDVNGEKLYNIITENFPGMEDKIIFMTGYAYSDELKKFLNSINNQVLPKPFNEDDLLMAITNHLSEKDI